MRGSIDMGGLRCPVPKDALAKEFAGVRRTSLDARRSSCRREVVPTAACRIGHVSPGQRQLDRPLQAGRNVQPKRIMLQIKAQLNAKGHRFMARDIGVKRIMGEGAFGQVFEGVLSGALRERRVVLKRVKKSVDGAEKMGEMEHVLNVYVSNAAGHCAAGFIGYCGVNREEARGKLTEGLWLIWNYEGDRTLSYYLRRRDCTSALAMDMDVHEQAVVPVVLQQILKCLQGLHSIGLVHRDIKPSNLILDEGTKQFKLIDLGACADLRSGTNYVPDESILDPNYCPPEQYVLPTDAPHLAKTPLAMAISPVLWALHKPERFDTYSAGLIFLQLSIPALRSSSALKAFSKAYHQHNYDLNMWRKTASLSAHQTAALDADGGAGWSLAAAMLRPRRIEQDADGGVKFIDDGSQPRLSAGDALKHRFFRQVEESHQQTKQRSPSALSAFVKKLFDLENRILEQAVATEQQTTTVMKLKQKADLGLVQKDEVDRAEKSLSKMVSKLGQLQEEFVKTSEKAFSLFGAVRSVGGTFGRFLSRLGHGLDSSGRIEKMQVHALEEQTNTNNVKESTTGVAENLIYAGLKFSGLAARIAGDLAVSFKNDAEKMLSDMEKSAGAKRQRRQVESQFMQLLQNANPSVTYKTSWEDVQKLLGNDPAFQAVQCARRKPLFDSFQAAAQKKATKAQKAAIDALRALYKDVGIDSSSKWEHFQSRLRRNEVFLAVEDATIRKELFDELVNKCHDELAEKQEKENQEQDFRVLLRELANPPITSASTWSTVKRQIFVDQRYQAVPESRRKALFEEYHGIIADIEAEKISKNAAKQAEHKRTHAARLGDGSGIQDEAGALERLQQLRQEQARLKEEYKMMAERLQEMEKKLEEKGVKAMMMQRSEARSDRLAGSGAPGTYEGPDGGIVMFHVDEGARW